MEWEHLRPVLDDVIDELKERDREIMLLRFFEGLSFAEVGARLNLSENAARMRTDRALDKLRLHLGRRGVTSSSTALGLMMANQVSATASAGLAGTVTTTALAAVPATSGIISFLLMTNIPSQLSASRWPPVCPCSLGPPLPPTLAQKIWRPSVRKTPDPSKPPLLGHLPPR